MLDYRDCYLCKDLVHARTLKEMKLAHATHKMPFQRSDVNGSANLCYYPAFEADKSHYYD